MEGWRDFLLLITTNQQFNGIMPSTVLFLLINLLHSKDSPLIHSSNLFLCGSLIYSFCLAMLTNAYFEKNGNNYSGLLGKYNWLALFTSILFFVGANLSLVANLHPLLHMSIYVMIVHAVYLYYDFKVSTSKLQRSDVGEDENVAKKENIKISFSIVDLKFLNDNEVEDDGEEELEEEREDREEEVEENGEEELEDREEEVEEEVEEGQEEVEDGQEEVEDGQAEVEDGQAEVGDEELHADAEDAGHDT
ncbi:Hypothetical protein ORPV_1188 [Orpheovirus IHUMI-LCC2]|uniref:Uncharacterized protein n=1 Tax=Orpheovirus IHUMI-LCC2 TaxID=2023057 RepID=A0A2I2L6B8_9VIRU|nr:Hypothetical protein ORPV_1188 [Orpheovirus IHUMI-LCC2]SNW63092.1 Hypothetical protein ORPV_1188 [Orpheovirus IHUMI-LCC2]